jgi:GT2 family glycosyltransferase
MNEPSVAAIVVNYKTPTQTALCVESLLGQQSVRLSVVVVDNRSEDGSYETLAGRFEGHPHVVVVQNDQNAGYARGNNLGLRWAESRFSPQYYLISNPDVVASDATVVSELIGGLARHAAAEISSPSVMSARSGLQGPYISATPLRFIANQLVPFALRFVDKQSQSSSSERFVERGIGAFFCIRAATFREVGLFDEDTFLYFEEEILAHKIRVARGHDDVWLYMPQLRVDHQDHVSAHDAAGIRRWNPYAAESAIYYFSRYHGAGSATTALIRVSDRVKRYVWAGLIHGVRRKWRGVGRQ